MFGFGLLALAALAATIGGVIAAAEKPAKSKPAVDLLPSENAALDLQMRWGVTPPIVREWCARAEAVAQQPGLARALAVAWWTVRQRGQSFLSPVDAAELAAKDPELCRLCTFPEQAQASTAALAKLIKAGWPKPADLAGWQSGAFGLGGILGSTAVFAGISETSNPAAGISRAALPLIDLPAVEAMQRWDVQAWLAAYLIWRYMGAKYKTIGPDIDAANAWANLFSAFLDPVAYQQGKGLEAKQEFMKRSQELGIDLAQLPHPGFKQPANFRPVSRAWAWMQVWKNRPVIDLGAVQAPPKEAPKPEPAPEPKAALSISLPGGYTGFALPQPVPAGVVPLVVLLHGSDADEKQLTSVVPQSLQARVIALRGPVKTPKGYSLSDVDLLSPAAAPAITAATSHIIEAVRKLISKFHASAVFVIGYDQGAAVALRLAALGMVDAAVAIGGGLPAALLPSLPSPTQAVRLVVGENDAMISASTIVEAYSKVGIPSAVNVVPGVDHALSPAILAAASQVLMAQVQAPLSADKGFHWSDDCKFFVDDVPVAQRYVVPRIAGSVAEGAEIGAVTRSVLTAGAGEKCKAAPTDPIDKTYARRYYLVARAILQTLALRGLLPVDQAKLALADTAKIPEKFGVAKDDLPELEV